MGYEGLAMSKDKYEYHDLTDFQFDFLNHVLVADLISHGDDTREVAHFSLPVHLKRDVQQITSFDINFLNQKV